VESATLLAGKPLTSTQFPPLFVAAHFKNGAVSHRQLVAPYPVYSDPVSTAVFPLRKHGQGHLAEGRG